MDILIANLGLDGAHAFLVVSGLMLAYHLLGAFLRHNPHRLAAAPDLFGLVWADRGERNTRDGYRHLYEAPPTEDFWTAWRANKAQLREAGFGCSRDARTGTWSVAFWERPSAEDLAARAAAAEEARAASRAIDAEVDLPVPAGLSYLPYQKAGILYASRRPATLIGDEMGLGKTVQALGVASYTGAKTVLIICPASLKLNWSREAAKWLCTRLPVHVVKKKWPEISDEGGVVIINYDIVHKWHDELRARTWDLLVCDEAHALKNRKARRTKHVLGHKGRGEAVEPIRAERRLLLTGTPIGNRPVELHPLLAYLDPQNWNNFFQFAKRYCNGHQTRFGWDFSGSSHLDELQNKLRETVMVRRLKKDVLTDLPAKVRQIVPLDVEDKALRALLDRQLEAHERIEAEKDAAKADMARAHRTGDSELYEDAAARLRVAQSAAFTELSKLRAEVGLAKVSQVLQHLEQVDQPVVVFAHHRQVVDALVAGMTEAGRTCVTVTGDMAVEDRQKSVDAFQGGTADVIVGTMGAMATGLTLTRSSHVVFAELDWVPATVLQSEDRCHRIGQRDSVLVQHLVFDGSLDAKMVQTLVSKQAVIDKALDAEVAAPAIVEAPAAPALDIEALKAIEAAAAAAVAEKKAQDARTQAEREAEAAANAAVSAEVVAQLRATIAERGWAMTARTRELATDLAGYTYLTEGQRSLARQLMAQVAGLVARTAERVRAAQVTDEAAARAKDPAVQAAALRGCRILSGMDMDWAAEENDMGWSAATTHAGHWLSEEAELDEHGAAYALAILRIHRKQLPRELEATLFG